MIDSSEVKHGPDKLNCLLTFTSNLTVDQVNSKQLTSTYNLENASVTQELKDILDNPINIEDTLSAFESLMGLTPDYS